ncbi:MAG: AmmeMemoRadiSam system protein B [Chlorobi bacterium]|nr:AmmeMemoRadiSam system protein B [Chlorobiota bacterium]
MRKPAVAGQFYPNSRDKLYDFFNSIKFFQERQNSYGLIVPHAGYIFSGETAFKTFYSTEIHDLVIILCPNHRGVGKPIGVSFEDWETPLGVINTDKKIASFIVEHSDAEEDELSHKFEHSLEVQLPIIQFFKPNVKIVAISIGTLNINSTNTIVNVIENVCKENKCLPVASSDMSHFVPAKIAETLDSKVIEKLKILDSDGMLKTVIDNNISMCGVGPAYVVTKLAKKLGAKKGEVIEYTNSGKVTNDYSDVVAYLGMRFV